MSASHSSDGVRQPVPTMRVTVSSPSPPSPPSAEGLSSTASPRLNSQLPPVNGQPRSADIVPSPGSPRRAHGQLEQWPEPLSSPSARAASPKNIPTVLSAALNTEAFPHKATAAVNTPAATNTATPAANETATLAANETATPAANETATPTANETVTPTTRPHHTHRRRLQLLRVIQIVLGSVLLVAYASTWTWWETSILATPSDPADGTSSSREWQLALLIGIIAQSTATFFALVLGAVEQWLEWRTKRSEGRMNRSDDALSTNLGEDALSANRRDESARHAATINDNPLPLASATSTEALAGAGVMELDIDSSRNTISHGNNNHAAQHRHYNTTMGRPLTYTDATITAHKTSILLTQVFCGYGQLMLIVAAFVTLLTRTDRTCDTIFGNGDDSTDAASGTGESDYAACRYGLAAIQTILWVELMCWVWSLAFSIERWRNWQWRLMEVHEEEMDK